MAKKNIFSYDEAMREVEQIVDRIERGGDEAKFDDLIGDVEKALKLLAQCKKNLSETEKQIADIANKIDEKDD